MSEEEEIHEHHIDRRVPPKIHRLAHHYHNLIYIMDFWERIGQQKPPSFIQEVDRAHQELMAELERERGQGGLLHKGEKHEARKREPRSY